MGATAARPFAAATVSSSSSLVSSATSRTAFVPLAALPRSTTRTMVTVTQTKVDDMPIHPEPAAAAVVEQSSSSSSSQDAATTNGVVVTDSCWKRVHALAKAKKDTDGKFYLRVFVDAGGCSGFTYQFEHTDEPLEDDDVVFTEPAAAATTADVDSVLARVVVDTGSLSFLQGSHVDYVQEMIKSSFEVRDNPNSESACGCGSSFALKNFASNPAMD